MAFSNSEMIMHQAGLAQKLNYDRQADGNTCDIILTSGGERFCVHQSVLMVSSNFFKAMFTVEVKGRSMICMKQIEIKQIPPKRLANIIDYIYTGNICINKENMLHIMDDSMYTQLEDLKLRCSAFIQTAVSVDNCIRLRTYAQQHKLDDLIEKCEVTIASNFAQIVHSDDFLQLMPDELKTLLKRKKKIPKNEEAAFQGLLLWVEHKKTERNIFFVELFSQLQLSLLCSDFLVKLANEDLVKNNSPCLSNVFDAYVESSKTPSTPTGQFILIGGETGPAVCTVYNVATKRSRALPSLNSGRIYPSSVKAKGKIYVLGGGSTSYNKALKGCEACNVAKRTKWRGVAAMHEARESFGSAYNNGRIYVTGGCSLSGRALYGCEFYGVQRNCWERMNDMLHRRFSHGTVICNDSLYCIGGYDGRRLASCERYHLESKLWTEIAPLQEARNYFSCVELNGFIFAIGGLSASAKPLATVERYDPALNTWEYVASLQIARRGAASCVVAKKIYVIGGSYRNGICPDHLCETEGDIEHVSVDLGSVDSDAALDDDDQLLKTVEVYDPRLDTWTVAFELDRPVFGATAQAL